MLPTLSQALGSLAVSLLLVGLLPGFLSWLKALSHLERKPLSTWVEMTEGTRSSSGMLAEAPQRCEKGVRGDAIEGAAGGGGPSWNSVGPET